jgi:MFS family permease
MPAVNPAEPRAEAGRGWWSEMNRSQRFVFTACSLAWLFDSLDQQLFNLARDGAMEALAGSPALATEYGPYTTSAFLVGWAVGGLWFGSWGDRFGRARMLTVCVLLYSVCTGLSAFAATPLQFGLYRLATGLGVGGVFGLAVALISDSVTDRSRPPALALLQGLSLWGNVGAGLLGIGIAAWRASGGLPFGLETWQALFLVGALPALLSVALFRGLREPDRWIRARERAVSDGRSLGSYRELFSHPRWCRHAWLGLAVCGAGIVGLWGIGNFHPKIVRSIVEADLLAQGASPDRIAAAKAHWASVALILQNLGGVVGMATLARVAQRSGRRPALGLALLLSFLSTVLVFAGLRTVGQVWWMLPLMGFGQLSVFCVYAIYLPELFPTGLRSTGTSFCYNVGRLVAATAPFTIGQITRRLGGDIEGFRTAGLWVSGVLLLGLLAIPFLPETRGKPLPEDT